MIGGRGREGHRLASALAFALVMAAAAGSTAQQSDSLLLPSALVILGGCLVGGILPARWWLSALVGLGVPLARVLAPAQGEAPPAATSLIATWIAPAVALAAGGLGAAMLRHLSEE